MIRKLLVAVVALLAIGGTVQAFAYWDNLEVSETAQTVTVGQGTSVSVTVNASATAGKNLVPAGVVMDTNEVDAYVFTYDVILDRTLTSDLTLGVVVSNLTVGGVAFVNNTGLVNVVVTGLTTVNGSAATVITVTVTLDEPADLAEYTSVATKDILFDLTFTASQ